MSTYLPNGLYTLRYGSDEGVIVGGMYATQAEFDAPIPVVATGPETHQTWKIERVNVGNEGDSKYHILTPHGGGVRQAGFHNTSTEEDAAVVLGEPKEFYIRVTEKANEYTISPTDETKLGIVVYIGDLDNTAVTKVIPVIHNPPSPPVWTISPSNAKVEG